MIFNDFVFIFAFLPLVIAAFYAAPGEHRTWVLLFASAVFYGWAGLEHLIVLFIDIVVVYALVGRGGGRISAARFWLSVIIPVLFLVYYKYMGFLIGTFVPARDAQESFSLFQDVVLPAGMSFFTFQLISYAIDRRSGRIEDAPRFDKFALYISFFPQLVAGPILRFSDVRGPLAELASYRPRIADVEAAAIYIVLGLAAKVLLADGVAKSLVPLTGDPSALTSAAAGYVFLGYSVQIYFDFYGYSLVAIGLGRLFGFRFPENFALPYASFSPQDFWRRWHITLSYWIRDYLYLPLGGNRRYLVNIFIVFAVCGLWHGAGWNFVAWGVYHGVLVAGYAVIKPWWNRLPHAVGVALTFTLVSLGWSLFLYDFQQAAELFQALFGLGSMAVGAPDWPAWLFLALTIIAAFKVDIGRLAEGRTEGWRPVGATVALGVVLGLSILSVGSSSTFIYFRF